MYCDLQRLHSVNKYDDEDSGDSELRFGLRTQMEPSPAGSPSSSLSPVGSLSNSSFTENDSQSQNHLVLSESGRQRQPPLSKRKNSEKRKQKSRVAARQRRNQEAELFKEMEQTLPLPHNAPKQMDKASVMRLGISYLKIRNLIDPLKCMCAPLLANSVDVSFDLLF